MDDFEAEQGGRDVGGEWGVDGGAGSGGCFDF